MFWAKLLLIIVYAGLSAGGLALMKFGARPMSPFYLAGFALYGFAFAVWLFAILPSLPLSVAFPVSAGAIVLATLAIGHLALNEPATLPKALGALLIIAGIAAIYFTPGAGVSGRP